MRFINFSKENCAGMATWTPDGWRGSITEGTGSEGSLQRCIEDGGAEGLSSLHDRLRRGELIDVDAVQPLLPLPSPGKIVCVGLNYSDHTAESGYTQPRHPTLFPRFASSLVPAGAPIVRPFLSDTLDFEGELVAVVGRGGRHIEKAAALSHVAGYSIFNDGSVRAYQHLTPQWTLGKNFDGTGGFGPAFVTTDELPAGADGLRIETRLNGQVVQSASTSQLIFDVATLVATISQAMTLAPGDIIVTGTPSGVGHARKPPLYMKMGDVCEVEIEGIGVLRNPIVDEVAPTGASREVAA